MQEGQSDPGLDDFAPWRGRPKIVWPQGKTVAVWVAPNLEFYELDPPANPLRKSWAKPHPDVVGYSHRDHANRVSHWRMADVMTRSEEQTYELQSLMRTSDDGLWLKKKKKHNQTPKQ